MTSGFLSTFSASFYFLYVYIRMIYVMHVHTCDYRYVCIIRHMEVIIQPEVSILI